MLKKTARYFPREDSSKSLVSPILDVTFLIEEVSSCIEYLVDDDDAQSVSTGHVDDPSLLVEWDDG